MKYNDNGLWKTLNVKVTDTLPVGTIIPYAGTTIPSNYMLCEGQELSRIEYDILFSAIGTTYGVGDGSTTFNLPNLKGRVITGIDSNDEDFDTLGETGGEKTHTLTISEMPSHTHKQKLGGGITTTNIVAGEGIIGRANTSEVTSTGGDQPHNNLQPYIVLNYIIKVLDAPAIQAQVVNGYSTSSRDSYSCNYINNAIGKLVWKNMAPNTGFEGQTITLSSDSTEYDLVEIIFKTGTGENDGLMSTGRIPISNAGHYSAIIGGNMYSRDWTISENQLTLSNASRWTSYGANATTNNRGMLPYYIIFYKNNILKGG